jgi:hypothetical protein
MSTAITKLQNKVTYDSLVKTVSSFFNSLEDTRNRSITYSFLDFLMSGFAMFSLKYPSLLQFENQSENEKANLKSMFNISSLCSDAQMRKVLDKVDPETLKPMFVNYFKQLKDLAVLDSYRVLDDYLICSVDGVHHYSSKEVHCDQCLVKNHRDGTTTYNHSMLAGVLVHPDHKEVFVLGAENITKQDGTVKNDCELNASKRLMSWMSTQYKGERIIFVEDALYANGPHIQEIVSNNWEYIINIKPNKHKQLFQLLDSRAKYSSNNELTHLDKQGVRHVYKWSNNMSLNNTCTDIKVNVLIYEQTDKKGKTKRFSWISSIKLTKDNVAQIMRIGRSRWKIENETFNTLKNQGYHFEHNYGHGKKYLASTLALLMLLAFLTDQIYQKCSTLFNEIWKAAKTKAKLWEMLRAFFMARKLRNFNQVYHLIAAQFFVQIE